MPRVLPKTLDKIADGRLSSRRRVIRAEVGDPESEQVVYHAPQFVPRDSLVRAMRGDGVTGRIMHEGELRLGRKRGVLVVRGGKDAEGTRGTLELLQQIALDGINVRNARFNGIGLRHRR